VRVGAVVSDLLLFSRIEAAATAGGVALERADRPDDLPAGLDLVLVDWSARQPGWAEALRPLAARVILFGPHTNLEAHADARAVGLGPMWARSRLVGALPAMLAGGRDPVHRRTTLGTTGTEDSSTIPP
jgi:hypothetical protein